MFFKQKCILKKYDTHCVSHVRLTHATGTVCAAIPVYAMFLPVYVIFPKHCCMSDSHTQPAQYVAIPECD